MSLLGIDIGSGAVKAVAFRFSGEILAQATEPYPTRFHGGNRAEAAPEDLWNAFAHACASVGAATASDPVEALAIASHGETFISIAENGQPIGPAIMNTDNRANEESKEIAEAVGYQALYQITGVPPHPMYTIAKIMWLKRHEPMLYDRICAFVTPAGYVQSRLDMPSVMDYSLAGRTSAFDLEEGDWSRTVLKAAGVATEMFPNALPAGTPLGQLSASAAKAVGLPRIRL
jgi:xylulokinase